MHYLLSLWVSNFLAKNLPTNLDMSRHRVYTTRYEDMCM